MEEDLAADLMADPVAPPRLFAGIERHGQRLAVLGPDGASWTHEALARAADRWAETHLDGPPARGLLASKSKGTKATSEAPGASMP